MPNTIQLTEQSKKEFINEIHTHLQNIKLTKEQHDILIIWSYKHQPEKK